jgi:hypothetical protein
MEDRILSVQFLIIVFGLMIGLTNWQCTSRNCYKMRVVGDKSSLVKGSPVVFGNGIVAYIENVKSSNAMLVAEFCLPNSIRIPKDSKIYAGFIQAFSVNGVKIEPGLELDFFNSKDLLNGISLDSIAIKFSESDTAVTNTLIDIMKDINEKQKSDLLNR